MQQAQSFANARVRRGSAAQSLGEELANSLSHGVGFVAAVVGTPFLLAEVARVGGVADLVGAVVFARRSCWPTWLRPCTTRCLAARQGNPAGPGSRLHLPADRRHLHAVHPRGAARRMGLDAVRAGLDAGAGRGRHEGLPRRAVPAPVGGVLPGHGLADRHRHRSAGGAYAGIRPRLAGRRRAAPTRLGVLFYALDRYRYCHFIWHLFVLAGTACHFVAVIGYAAARRALGQADGSQPAPLRQTLTVSLRMPPRRSRLCSRTFTAR
jgi:hemolysin III